MSASLVTWIYIIVFCNGHDGDQILDIEDYQFHFKTTEYKFDIQPTHKIIKLPVNGNNHLNLVFDIDFNSTISLSFDNITLDFFNIDDFTEINYISSINTNDYYSSHRSLLDYYYDDEPELIEEDPGATKDLDADMEKKVERMKLDLKKEMKELKEKHEAKQKAKEHQKKVQNGEEETGQLEKEKSLKKEQEQMKKQNRNNDDKKGKSKKKKGVKHELHEKEQEENPWRNHAFDDKEKEPFPSNKEWRDYRRFNKYKFPRGVNDAFDRYAKRREHARKKAGKIYHKLHGLDGDMPGHGPEALRKRYMKIKHKKPKIDHYPPPADEPRSEPYHHGKYIGIPERRNWFMAQQFCREQYGTNLASISDQKELLEVRHVCNQINGYGHCWIGLHRPFGTWMNGKAVVFKNWEAQGVNNWHELPLNCVEMVYDDEKWHAQLCTVTRSFVCETPRSRTRGKFIAVGKALSWETAEKYCQRTYNSDLAVINNRRENRLAMNLCRDINYDGHHCWIGLVSPFDLWSDGAPTGYRNFGLPYMSSPDHFSRNMRREGPEPYSEDKYGNIINYHTDLDHEKAVKHQKKLTDKDKFKLAMLKLAKMEHDKKSSPPQTKPDQKGRHDKDEYDYAGAHQLGPNHANAPDDMMENAETRPYRKNEEDEAKNDEIPDSDDKLEKDLEKLGDEMDKEADKKNKEAKKDKKGNKADKKKKDQSKSESKDSKEKINESEEKEKENENESEETTVQTIEEDETENDQNDQSELEGRMRDADEKEANEQYLADLDQTKKLYHQRNPHAYAALHHRHKIPKDDCSAIQTSYGGKWTKRRCSFRHYFLCNNPSKHTTSMHHMMMGMNRFGMYNRMNSRFGRYGRYGNMNRMGMGMTLPYGMNGNYGMRGMNHMNRINGMMNGMHNRMNTRMSMNGMSMNHFGGMNAAIQRQQSQFGMHGMNQYGMHHRRRLLDVDENIDKDLDMDMDLDLYDDEFLGGLLKKVTGAVGGLFRKKRMKKRDNRRRKRREHEERLWRRRERRRRRIRRRRRFKRWLKRHYGTGHKRSCHGHCPYKHLHIRTLPEDMHWTPLSGLLPLFGADGIHRHKLKKHHKPKIKIVAKVHLPKHREVDNGYLDYDLLSNLLFGPDNHQKNGKKQTLHDFNRREEDVEKMINSQMDRNKDEAALMKLKHDHDGLQKYRRWDRINERRAEDGDDYGRRRRRMMMGMTDAQDGGVKVVSRCKIFPIYGCEICLKYFDNEMMFGVDIRQFEKRELRVNKRRIFRELMNVNQSHYRDYQILDIADVVYVQSGSSDYVLFEPIDGNLGYAIHQYEAFENAKFSDNHAAVGQFDGFKDYIRVNKQFEIVFDAMGADETQCSVKLLALPFRMCKKDNVIFFEKDDKNDIFDPSFSFLMKEFIDFEFEQAEFMLDNETNWDEMNVINEGQYIELCNFMHIAKVCVRKDGNSNLVISASITFQYANKINN